MPLREDWPLTLLLVAGESLRRTEALRVARLAESRAAQFELTPRLGRDMLDMKQSMNNALTSMLGNAELLLLEPGQLSTQSLAQIKTIHTMALRINEIMQRFSSLASEMRDAENASQKLRRIPCCRFVPAAAKKFPVLQQVPSNSACYTNATSVENDGIKLAADVHLFAAENCRETYVVQKKVLIVDDSPSQVRLMQGLLETEGYEGVGLNDPKLIEQTITAETPSVILLDVVMPERNGFQVCRELKNNTKFNSDPGDSRHVERHSRVIAIGASSRARMVCDEAVYAGRVDSAPYGDSPEFLEVVDLGFEDRLRTTAVNDGRISSDTAGCQRRLRRFAGSARSAR